MFPKYTQAIPKDEGASTVADVLVKHWFHLFGPLSVDKSLLESELCAEAEVAVEGEEGNLETEESSAVVQGLRKSKRQGRQTRHKTQGWQTISPY